MDDPVVARTSGWRGDDLADVRRRGRAQRADAGAVQRAAGGQRPRRVARGQQRPTGRDERVVQDQATPVADRECQPAGEQRTGRRAGSHRVLVRGHVFATHPTSGLTRQQDRGGHGPPQHEPDHQGPAGRCEPRERPRQQPLAVRAHFCQQWKGRGRRGGPVGRYSRLHENWPMRTETEHCLPHP